MKFLFQLLNKRQKHWTQDPAMIKERAAAFNLMCEERTNLIIASSKDSNELALFDERLKSFINTLT